MLPVLLLLLSQVVRISRAGYPTRYAHASLAEQYKFLLPPDVATRSAAGGVPALVRAVIQRFGIGSDQYQIGKTKVFFRAGTLGRIENLRLRSVGSVVKFQAYWRGFQQRQAFLMMKGAAIMIQAQVRRHQAMRRYAELRRKSHAAVKIQAHVRGWLRAREYAWQRYAAVLLQAAVRGYLERRRYARRRVARKAEKELQLQNIEGARARAVEAEARLLGLPSSFSFAEKNLARWLV